MAIMLAGSVNRDRDSLWDRVGVPTISLALTGVAQGIRWAVTLAIPAAALIVVARVLGVKI